MSYVDFDSVIKSKRSRGYSPRLFLSDACHLKSLRTRISMQATRKPYAIAILAGVAFTGLQVHQLLQYYLSPLSLGNRVDVPSVTATLNSTWLPAALVISGYVITLALTHVALMLFATWAHSRVAVRLGRKSPHRLLPLLGTLFFAGLLATLWNRRLFPNSVVFPNSDLLLIQPASPILFWGLTIAAGLVAGLALLDFATKNLKVAAVLTVAGVILLIAPTLDGRLIEGRNSSVDKPDIILIGIDSLRPDFLPLNGFPEVSLTPTINAELARSVVFEDTLTPLARTFAAYMTILSGQYPTRNGVRENLYPRELFDRSELLPRRLQRAGYQTFYTTDESRFSNIDESFGFDNVSSPPIGALDFLLGTSFDTVATNILSLSRVSRWITPHIHGNRAAHRTYRPAQHTLRHRKLISRFDPNRPVFFLTHLCLPHWPYWSGHRTARKANDNESPQIQHEDYPSVYLSALQEVDRQVQDLLDMLRAADRLNNAIVVIFSDHGEAFGSTHDRITSLDPQRRPPYQGYAHGNFVLDQSQYRVLLGFQKYVSGQPAWPAHTSGVPATLVDIAPTLLTTLDIEYAPDVFDGDSLVASLQQTAQAREPRLRFVESGISGASVDTSHVDERITALEFSDLYTTKSDFRLEIDLRQLEGVLAGKQRGVYGPTHALTTIPTGGGPDSRNCWTLMDIDSKVMECINRPSSDPIAAPLYAATCHHFKNDSQFVKQWCGDDFPNRTR